MGFVNLTPHSIRVIGHYIDINIPPSGVVARVATRYSKIGQLDEIEIGRIEYGEIENLPPPNGVDYYIVSNIVFQAVPPDRHDVLCPDTSPGGVIRDEAGQIIGVRRLICK